MITKKGIEYHSIALQTFQFDSHVVNTIIYAILTTTLAYQATAILVDLFLGVKPAGITNASVIHTVLLSDEGSFISALGAIFRNNFLDRRAFHARLPKDTILARFPKPVSKKAACRLICLLVAAPLINLLSIVLTFEHNRIISFSKAGFHGAVLTVPEDPTYVERVPSSGRCDLIPMVLGPKDEPLSVFTMCATATPEDVNSGILNVTVRKTLDEGIEFQLDHFTRTYTTFINAGLDSEGEFYRLKVLFDGEVARRFLLKSAWLYEKACPASSLLEEQFRSQTEPLIQKTGDNYFLSNFASCRLNNSAIDGNYIRSASRIPTFAENDKTEDFNVSKIKATPGGRVENESVRATDLKMFRMRRSTVSIGVLAIVVACGTVCRMIVKVLTNNDVDDAVEAIMNKRLGTRGIGDLLRKNDVIRYDHKYQIGEVAYYGLELPGVPEVHEFKGGVLGGSTNAFTEGNYGEKF